MVGSEIQLSSPVNALSASGNTAVDVACGPTECALVMTAYIEDRVVAGAQRVKRDGTLLDAHPVLIAPYGATYGAASVRASNSGFAIVTNGDVYLLPTTSGGDTVTKLNVAPYGGVYIAGVGSNGDKYLIATLTSYGDPTAKVFTQVVSQTDTEAPPAKHAWDIAAGDYEVAIAAAPDQFLLAAADGTCVRVSTAGAVLDSTPIRYADRMRASYRAHAKPAAVYDGLNYLIVWDRADIMFTGRVGTDGTVLDPDDDFNDLSGSHPMCQNCYPQRIDAWFDGRDVVVTYYGGALQADYKTSGFRVDIDTALQASASAPDFTVDKTNVRLTYGEDGGLALLKGLTPLSVPAQPGGPTLGTAKEYRLIGERQEYPAVASNGSGFLVAWVNHDPDGKHRILASRVSAAGVAQDDPPLEVGTTSADAGVALAWAKDSYVVVWSNANKVLVRGIDQDGLVPTTTTIASATGLETAVGCNDEYCLAGWAPAGYNGDVVLQGIRLDASTLAPVEAAPFAISDYNGGSARGISIAADTTPVAAMRTFLVAWVSRSKQRLLTRRIRSHLGTLQDIVLGPSSSYGPTQPIVTSPGSDFAVIFNYEYNAGNWLYKVDAVSGAADKGTWIPAQWGTFPTLTHDGIDYVATFYDATSTITRRFGSRIDASGTVVDTKAFFINESAMVTDTGAVYQIPFHATPGAASDKAGHTLLAYMVVDGATLTTRIRAQLISNTLAEVDTGAGGEGGQGGAAGAPSEMPPVAGSGGAAAGTAGTGVAALGGEPGVQGGAPGDAGSPTNLSGSTAIAGTAGDSGAPSGSGSGGSGASPAAGEASAGTGGSAASGSESGCGCRLSNGERTGHGERALLGLAALFAVTRRRSRRRSSALG